MAKTFYCIYTAAMSEETGLVDPTYQGEIDVQAEDQADASTKVAAYLAEHHPADKLISCTCEELA